MYKLKLRNNAHQLLLSMYFKLILNFSALCFPFVDIFVTEKDFNTWQKFKFIDDTRICKRSQPRYLISEVHSRETAIKKHQSKQISNEICQFSVFRILELIFIPLNDPNQYILIPEMPLELNVSYGSTMHTIKVSFASLLSSD